MPARAAATLSINRQFQATFNTSRRVKIIAERLLEPLLRRRSGQVVDGVGENSARPKVDRPLAVPRFAPGIGREAIGGDDVNLSALMPLHRQNSNRLAPDARPDGF